MSLIDSRYMSDVEEIIEHLTPYKDLATLSIFRNANILAPALSFEIADMLAMENATKKQQEDFHDKRKRLYGAFVRSKAIRFIETLNVRGLNLDLDHEIVYDYLTTVVADGHNLLTIASLFKAGKLPHLKNLTIYLGRVPDLSTLGNVLTSLSLHNTSSTYQDVVQLPRRLDFGHLKELRLSRYNVGYFDDLPPIVHLEYCMIDRLGGRRNEELTLIECVFGGEDDKPEGWFYLSVGFPTRVLRLEHNFMLGFILLDSLATTLEEITLIKTLIGNSPEMDFSRFNNLKLLKIDDCMKRIGDDWKSDIDYTTDYSHFEFVDTLAIEWNGTSADDPTIDKKLLPRSLKVLSLKGGGTRSSVEDAIREINDDIDIRTLSWNTFEYPQTLVRIDFTNLIIDLLDFFGELPRGLTTLHFYQCVFIGGCDETTLPDTLTDLAFINCVCSNNNGVALSIVKKLSITVDKLPLSVKLLTVVGDSPRINRLRDESSSRTASERLDLTIVEAEHEEVALSLDLFKLYCLDMSSRNTFPEYDSIFMEVHRRGEVFFSHFLSVAFIIQLPKDDEIFLILIGASAKVWKVNQNTQVFVDNAYYTIESIVETMNKLIEYEEKAEDGMDAHIVRRLKAIIRKLEEVPSNDDEEYTLDDE